MKRICDLAIAIPIVLLTAPVFAVLAVLIKLDATGPVFYRGVRIGRFAEPFYIFKFRTMVSNAEQVGGYCTADDDARITRIGRVLRRYKLDELPQLLNVLNGTMSIVGPRPEVKKYTDMYSEDEKVILTVRPGITDWATIWNSDEGALLRGAPDPEQTYLDTIRPEKLRLQLKYIREANTWTDLKIVWSTLTLMVKRCLGFNEGSRVRILENSDKES